MAEQLFLCGLSTAQRFQYKGGRELHLQGSQANLRLNIDDIRCRLLDVEPTLLTDLLEIAVYVFAADTAVRRGGPTFRHMGTDWRRKLRLVIGVREPGWWSEPQSLNALRELLHFLSDDTWAFEFLSLENPPRIQSYLGYADANVEKSDGTTVVLFSGGLDSFAGAVHELNNGNSHIVLVSRRIPGSTEHRQKELARVLKARHPNRVTHVPVTAGLTKDTAAVEHTQRTRSFLLAAIAMVAAVMEEAKRIRFYENGIMSVNLPISSQVVGTRASRSTHPRSLMLLSNLVRAVWQHEIRIENPFIWRTKVEVVRELHLRPEGEQIGQTFSCSRTRDISIMHPHCGKCAQCLHRRIAILGARADKADPQEAYEVDLLTGPRQDGEHRAMAVDMVRSALEYHRFSNAEFATRFAGEFAWLTTSFPGQAAPDVAQRVIAMCKRHGEAVREIFVRATEQQAEALVDKTLPPSCLLRMVHDSPDMRLDETAITSPRPPPQVSDDRQDGDKVEQSEIVIAIDQKSNRVVIDGIAPIKGSSEFRAMSALISLYVEDQRAGRLPRAYRTLSAAHLAEAVSTAGDTSARQVVSRLRRKISDEFRELHGTKLSLDAVIENLHGKGYRINPAVRVVAPDELARR